MYSQNNEEKIILDYFNGYTGTLCSIGENDGETLSNVRELIKRGWKADLIEPSPTAYKKLWNLYQGLIPDVMTHEIAITETDGDITLFESGEHLGKGDTALLSSTVRTEINRWEKETFTPVKVKGLSFNSFLYIAQHKNYDFISIDAEGLDVRILFQIDLKDTRCICIEWNGDKGVRIVIETYCLIYGLNVIHVNSENLILAR